MTMMKHIKDARVRHIGVRIHAKRPTLPMFAVAVVVLLLAMAVLLLLDWLSFLGFGSSVDVVLLWRRAWYTSLRISPGRLR